MTKWPIAQLGDIATIQSGGTPSRSVREYWDGDIPWIKISDLTSTYVTASEERITTPGLENSSAKVFPKGTILLTIFATIGKVAILDIAAATNQAIAGITPRSNSYGKFLYYALVHYSNDLLVQGKGVAQKNINLSILKKLHLPLPTISEQKLIAAKLDKLFDHLHRIRERLDKIPALLKQFRQAVLTQAVTGKLTKNWNRGDSQWKKEKASECCEVVQSGGTPRAGFVTDGVPFLKVYNIVNQRIDFDYRPQFIAWDVHQTGQKKSITIPGDVIMNIVGPPLGKVAIVPDTYPEWNINQAVTLFRPKKYLNNKYLYLFFCQGKVVKEIMSETRGVVGQVNISLSQCRNFEIDIPPYDEQLEIVGRVESLFIIADRIEARYIAMKEKIDQLPQLILSKAFKGELVKGAEKEYEMELNEMEGMMAAEPAEESREKGMES